MNQTLLEHHDRRFGVLLCGHGSRNRLAVEEFEKLAYSIKERLPGIPLEHGFLEFAQPIIPEALDRLRASSIEQALAVPAMLFAAGHAKNDIPSVLNKYSSRTGLEILYGKELGVDNQMISAAAARINEVVAQASYIPPQETLLVVVGRGSSDPDANSNVSKITRMLVEAFGFGWGETVYSGVTFPLVEPGLRHAIRLGFKRVIVFPYLLFSGVLVSRIRQHTNRVAVDHPDIEFLNADYLGNQNFVVNTFIERIEQILIGDNSMNCSLCKYRSSLPGFEKEVGLAQHSHHHHVEGLPESCTLCEEECTGECQEANNSETLSSYLHHDHDHFPYPNADHPFGPGTLR